MDLDFQLLPVGDDREADLAHLRGMAAAYGKVGYGSLVPDLESLTAQPAYLLTGYHDHVPVAGLRFHIRNEIPLPTETNFDDALVTSVVRALCHTCDTVGEAAGTWVAPSLRGTPLGSVLVSLALSSCLALDVDVCIGSSPVELTWLYKAAGALYIEDHPLPDTPLPGVTGLFFYSRVPSKDDALEDWEQHSFVIADELRTTGRISQSTFKVLTELFLAQCAAGAPRRLNGR